MWDVDEREVFYWEDLFGCVKAGFFFLVILGIFILGLWKLWELMV